MRESVLNWLKLYEDEVVIFLWTAALLFFVRSSGMILNNYAETAFLKRYGIEYMPIVNMINTVVTFFITGVMAAFMSRMPGSKILFYLFIFCGLLVTMIRLSIPMGVEIVYPLLFMLKSQFELLQALLFWNLANDLFNTRQAKRIFPLLTAGGVIGLIISSFATPYMAKLFQFDNLLFVYLATTLAGAALIKGMGRQFPAIVQDVHKEASAGRKKNSISEEIRRILPLLRQSTLFKIVLVLTFMPNVVIPIMNYQFNFAVDQHFPTETGMLVFFSYFRGVLNVISLIILLFVGRLYGFFGLPVALIMHPLNYAFAFMAFFLHFSVFAAVYARMSTNVLRTTVNMPATSILIGLFPESYRAMVRPFLRGTVVRAGLLLGSALILTSVNTYHPKFLSLVALPFVLAWMAAPLLLKRNYTSILQNLVSSKMLDIKSLEEKKPSKLFKKDSAGRELVQAYLTAQNDDAVWYARLLKSLEVDEVDALILKTLENHDESTQIRLLGMLSGNPDSQIFEALKAMLPGSRPQLKVAILKAMKKSSPGRPASGNGIEVFRPLLADADAHVRGYAAACLHAYDPSAAAGQINAWLSSEDVDLCQSGVVAAGESGRASDYRQKIEAVIHRNDNALLVADALRALKKLGGNHLNELAVGMLGHAVADVRRTALSVMTITDADLLNQVIGLLGDTDQDVRMQAKETIKAAPFLNGQILISSLNIPNRYVRENILDLLETLQIKNLDLYRFTSETLEQCYICLAKAAALQDLEDSNARRLLLDHLVQKKDLLLETIFRVFAIYDRDGRMKTLRRGLFSSNNRVRGDSIELLGNIMDKRSFRMVQPLLEGFSLIRTLASGRKYFRLPAFDKSAENLFPALLNSRDWIEVVLAISTLQAMADAGVRAPNAYHAEIITGLCSSAFVPVQQAAERLSCSLEGTDSDMGGKIVDNALTIADKILLLKKIAIFSGLGVSELGAIATVTETAQFPANKTVIKEGEPGEEVFLIIAGAVSVHKQGNEKKEIQLDAMKEGDYFGEMALFEETERSATIRTTAPSRFLILHKQEFNELVREYPRIALQICTALSQRLRNLQSRVAQAGK